jgi:hypothetical protein
VFDKCLALKNKLAQGQISEEEKIKIYEQLA